MSFFVWLELRLSIKMNTQWRYIDQRALWVPKHALEWLFILWFNNDSPGKSEIPIKPRSPKTTPITLYIHLLITTFIFNLGMWSQLQNWRVSMCSNNFEKINPLMTLLPKSKCNNRRLISSVVIRTTSLELPGIDFPNLIEAVLTKLVFHVFDCVEVWDARFKTTEDVLRVRSSLFQ